MTQNKLWWIVLAAAAGAVLEAIILDKAGV